MDPSHLRELSTILGHKWDLVILSRLTARPLRYMELAHEVREVDGDLTEGVLSKNLKRLAASGLIVQEPIDNHRHTWNLTSRGRYIVELLIRITDLDEPEPRPDERDDEPDSDGDDAP